MKNSLEIKLAELGYLVLDSRGNSSITDIDMARFCNTLFDLGFILDYDSLQLLKKCSNQELGDFYLDSYKILRNLKGTDVKHIVFYKNFPDMSYFTKEDYILHAIFHYMTASKDDYGYMAEDISAKKHEKEHIEINPMTLQIISSEEAKSILTKYFTTLLEANKSISFSDFSVMEDFLKEFGKILAPNTIPFHHNLVLYMSKLLNKKDKIGDMLEELNLDFLTTVTDVLRLYSVLSGNEILGKYNRFKSFDRKGRRIILSYLDQLVVNKYWVMDDFHMHEVLWKKVFRLLHIGEYKDLYPAIYDCAKKLRSGEYQTFNSKVTAYLNTGDRAVYDLLKLKPGYFARMLDAVLRNPKFDMDQTLDEFSLVAKNVSIPVLISLLEYYLNRNDLALNRYFMYRYDYYYVNYKSQENRIPYSEEDLEKIISSLKDAISERYADLEPLDGVYLDECMKNYMLPLNNVNESSGLHTLPFASKIKLDDTNMPVLRFFTHWKNTVDERVDIDLSLELYDADFNYVESLAWHDMHSGHKYHSYHSGDFVTAPKGASEFIDLNYVEARPYAKYVVVFNSIYSGPTFADIPECFSGLIFQPSCGGKIFDPKKVQIKFDLACKGCYSNVAFILDLENLELIWCDMPSSDYCVASENPVGAIIKKAVSKHITLYDLAMLHQKHITFTDKEHAISIIDDSDNSILNPFHRDSILKWI